MHQSGGLHLDFTLKMCSRTWLFLKHHLWLFYHSWPFATRTRPPSTQRDTPSTYAYNIVNMAWFYYNTKRNTNHGAGGNIRRLGWQDTWSCQRYLLHHLAVWQALDQKESWTYFLLRLPGSFCSGQLIKQGSATDLIVYREHLLGILTPWVNPSYPYVESAEFCSQQLD